MSFVIVGQRDRYESGCGMEDCSRSDGPRDGINLFVVFMLVVCEIGKEAAGTEYAMIVSYGVSRRFRP